MFRLKRLNLDDGESSWVLPYGDLMSLLLVVFVMIAAMSELGAGPRFTTVSRAVQSAFGFVPDSSALGAPDGGFSRRLTLLERLEQAGLRSDGTPSAVAAAEVALACCDVVVEPDRVAIRIAGPASFEAFSASMKPAAIRAAERLAVFLAGGQAQLEIRGHNGDGPLPASVPFRDGMDLSYERARAVADVLIRAGVSRDRIRIGACDDSDPLAWGQPANVPDGANRRIEIIVHAVPAAHNKSIAEKEGILDG